MNGSRVLQVLHMAKWIGFFEFMTFLPAYLAVGLIVVAAHLYCKFATSAWVVTGVACAMGCVLPGGDNLNLHATSRSRPPPHNACRCVFQGGFAYTMSYALPYNCWAWMTVASGWMLSPLAKGVKARVEATGRVHGQLLLAQAREGVLAGLDEDDDYVIDAAPTERKKAEEATLLDWVCEVLRLPSTKAALLAGNMVTAGLTKERLVEAAALPGGFQVRRQSLSLTLSSSHRASPGPLQRCCFRKHLHFSFCISRPPLPLAPPR
jgi:hypothetical protein